MQNDSAIARTGARPLPDRPALIWNVIVHRDGARTLTLGGQAIGYYSRIHYRHAKGRAAGWRGVTHTGTLVYAPTERRAREMIQEAYRR